MTRRWVILLASVAVVAGVAYGGYFLGFWRDDFLSLTAAPSFQNAPSRDEPQPAIPSARRIRAEARLVPIRSVELGMLIAGTVQEVLVQEGDQVTKGQLLVKLKDSRQRVLVAQAEATLRRAQAAVALLAAGPNPAEVAQMEAALAAAQANYAKLAEGLTPGAIAAAAAALGQAQADYRMLTRGADPQEMIEATANLELAQAQLNQASAAYNKVRGDPDIGMLPEALEMQEATAAYNAAKARYDLLQGGVTPELTASAAATVRVAQAELDALQQAQPGELAEAEALVRQAQAGVEFVKSFVRAEEIAVAQGDVDIAIALLQDALVALSETELRAPFDGVITTLDIDSGELVTPNAPLLQLADLSAWRVETLDLSEIDVATIAPGDRVDVTFDALPSLLLKGKVVHIRPVGENSNVASAAGAVSANDTPLTEQIGGDIVYRAVIALEMHDARLLWNMTALVDFGARPSQ
ncbi:MAG: HlyD family efflux transporter periplasmic adaptor subunit [Caldilineaceae bacterium]|jgi:HlyD family secretion protein|nr:HlyD family efflux transporter periplasmic adaptor subunit [Caldilineaceae bacterium]